ncbi:hypothetical protein CBR_g46627 [Chara braunii]|uniref:Chromo domain-containing protein n=1 Tax=Chara braunii TaxID=69332 RepID=A0A388M0Y1_CHABU|nr:hypothetical protein CBR_g46627 [Chara braunii]|eukprot:GBG88139.1 hypothetical protein CBR_g46627 [Chara braunii]
MDHIFKVGDDVLVDARHLQLEADTLHMFRRRFFGSCRILQVVGSDTAASPISFRVKLLDCLRQARVHDVYHVFLLRPYRRPSECFAGRSYERPSPIMVDGHEEFVVSDIVSCRVIDDTPPRIEYLVRWKDYPDEEATWEPLEYLEHPRMLVRAYDRARRAETSAPTQPTDPLPPRQAEEIAEDEPAPSKAVLQQQTDTSWVRCPMGICNVPATFQRAMNMTFQNFVNKTRLTQGMINFCVIVYMDDILVYSETYHGHAQHIERTLGALRDAGFKIALEKSEFFLSEISFLGYIVTRGGLRPDSRKVAAVKEAPVPTSLTQIEFRWSEAAPFGEGPEHPEDSVEILIIQAWRTAEQGDLLGFLFGKVDEGNLTLITDELLVFLTQLADDLPLDILSHSDKQPGTHVLSRTLEPHFVWSMCTEIDEDNCLYPSQALYLDIDVTDLMFWDPIARQNVAQDEEIRRANEEEEEEEPSSEERDDPDYVLEREAGIADESNQPQAQDEGVEPEEEEGSGLSGSECEGFEVEVRNAARERARERRKRKRQKTAEGKRPTTDVSSVDPSIGDPRRDPEPPEEEDDGTTTEGSRSRRRRRSESPAPSGSPSRSSLRLHQDLNVPASSPVVLLPTP